MWWTHSVKHAVDFHRTHSEIGTVFLYCFKPPRRRPAAAPPPRQAVGAFGPAAARVLRIPLGLGTSERDADEMRVVGSALAKHPGPITQMIGPGCQLCLAENICV
jgi:hypothetical protein